MPERAALPRWLIAAAVLVFSGFFWAGGWRASVVVDDVRYHYLDDDEMISMRYARNLADGHGPVWNAGGERVEGYTNFGWMVVMAAVHRLGAPDATAALWVRAVNWGLGIAVLLLSALLLRRLGVPAVPSVAAVGALAMSYELLFWSINGFETTLLTVVFLWAIVRGMRDGEQGRFSAVTCLVAGLLPVVRADAADLTLAVMATSVALGARRRWWLVALAALPIAGNEIFRVAYYGDWLPNTYYLKVAGRSGLFRMGAASLKAFVSAYAAALVLSGAAFALTKDRRVRVLACLVGLGMARVLLVGPDIFPGFRFLAPYVPLLLVSAAAAIGTLSPRTPALAGTLAATLLLTTVFNAGVGESRGIQGLTSINGGPRVNTVSGVLLRRHARPDSSVVVAAAGCLGYFSRLEAIDMLGKSDHYVARVKPATESGTGHNRFDVDWSLRRRPDFIATFGSYDLASKARVILPLLHSSPASNYGAALLLNATFVREYGDTPVPLPYLLDHNALFVHVRSAERWRLRGWRTPRLDQP